MTDVHCTFAHTPEYKKQHDQILALEELDRKRLEIHFPVKVFFRDNKKVMELKDSKRNPAKAATASGSPQNYSCLKGKNEVARERKVILKWEKM